MGYAIFLAETVCEGCSGTDAGKAGDILTDGGLSTMRLNKILLTAIIATGAIASPMAQADQCTSSGCGLDVNFSMNIPSVFRFSLGSTTATEEPTVTWSAGTISAANIGTGTDIPSDTIAGPGAGGSGSNNTTQVRYALLSNLAETSVTIAASGGNLTSGANTIPLTEIVSTGTDVTTGSGITMPAAGSSTNVNYPGSGVINEIGYWNYAFDNTTIYPAGTYTGTITYTATSNP